MNDSQTIAAPSFAAATAARPRLENALTDAASHEAAFATSLAAAAEASGCTVLFELPAALAGPQAVRVAALSTGAPEELLWAALESGQWRLYDSEDVSETMDHLTRSYAGVLGMLAESAVSLN